MPQSKPQRYSDGRFSVSRGKNYRVNRIKVPLEPLDDPRFRVTADALKVQAVKAGNLSPAVGLSALSALRYHADKLEHLAVINARMLGWSWGEIGEALGISKQVLHKRYAQATPRLRRRYYHPSPFSKRFLR
jgi:DNA-directed RNA polymerase specialized sigma24 family protein